MKSRLTRRQMLKSSGGVLAGAYLLGITGCGGGGSGGNAEMRMSWWGSQERHERTNEALQLFQERNPEIEISTEFTDFNQYWDRLATQASGGNAPDVIQTDYRYLTEYSGRGVLLDLNEFVPDPINLENFDEAVLEGGRIDGATYAITLGNNSQMLAYDVARFEEAGVEPPGNDWTWDDFAEVSLQISEATEDGFFGTEDAGGLEPTLEVFLTQKGLKLYNENGELGFEGEDLAEWFQYWEDLRQSGAAAPGDVQSVANSGDLEATPLIRAAAATEFGFSNQYTGLVALTDRELELTVMPNGTGEGSSFGQYLKPSQLISAYSRTEYPEESARIINFLLNDPEANMILGTERGISGNSEIREMLRGEVPETEQRIFEYLDYVTEIAAPLPPPPPQGAAEIDMLLLRTNENISFGRTNIGQAVEQFMGEAQRILEQAAE